MNVEKQRLLLQYTLSDPNLYAQVHSILNPTYFDPKLSKVGRFIREYYEQHKSIPTPEVVRIETGESFEAKAGLTKSEMSYAAVEIESFCKNKAIEQAILASPQLLQEGKFGEIEKKIREAITVGLHKNLGVDYFLDPEERLRLMELNLRPTSTGWVDIDQCIAGGLNRKEMIIFAAALGVGKSLTMSNLACNLLAQGLNGLYITLELSEQIVAKRFDSLFSGIGQQEILTNISAVSTEIIKQADKHGKLFIKRMPENTTNANQIRAYLKEFELVNGFIPDFVCVDYLDLLDSNQKISAENLFVKDKYIAEELRSIADQYDMFMITASQLNRSVHDMNIDEISPAQIAGGISKGNTADNMIAIIQDDLMKANNEYMFKFLKTRGSDGVGKYVKMKINRKSLRVYCDSDNRNELTLKTPNTARSSGSSSARSLLDIMKT
jgi:archaellum biogenesis ATPase FlaH